jgi:hypothetical protein
MEKRLLRENELSDLFNIPVKTLRNDRGTHQRIPFLKIGFAVYYDPIKVQKALDGMSFPKTRKRKSAAAESRRAESKAAP